MELILAATTTARGILAPSTCILIDGLSSAGKVKAHNVGTLFLGASQVSNSPPSAAFPELATIGWNVTTTVKTFACKLVNHCVVPFPFLVDRGCN